MALEGICFHDFICGGKLHVFMILELKAHVFIFVEMKVQYSETVLTVLGETDSYHKGLATVSLGSSLLEE